MRWFASLLCLLVAGLASADGLLQNTQPAERARGCSFADHFRNQAEVEANGATVTGAPTFSVDAGVTLDGAADYLTYRLCGTELDSDPISFVFEFTPDFDHDENVFRTFFDNTAGNRYYMYKRNNAIGNDIILYLGNTVIAGIPEATYSPSWAVGERHLLVISGTTGSTDAWLINATGGATQILTANATAWTPDDPTELYIGSTNAGANRFDGTIHSLQVYKAKLTAQEAQDFYDQTVYDYRNQATAVYPMGMAQHDPTGNQTLDASGNGLHLTDVSDPVKLATHGYEFDGANDYFRRADDGSFDMDLTNNPGGDFSVQCVVMPATITGTDTITGKYLVAGNQRAWRLVRNGTQIAMYISNDGIALTAVGVGGVFAVHRRSFITVTYHYVGAANSQIRIYVDNLTGSSNAISGPVFDTAADFVIGGYDGPAEHWDGRTYECSVFKGTALTELQHHDFVARAKKQLQRI